MGRRIATAFPVEQNILSVTGYRCPEYSPLWSPMWSFPGNKELWFSVCDVRCPSDLLSGPVGPKEKTTCFGGKNRACNHWPTKWTLYPLNCRELSCCCQSTDVLTDILMDDGSFNCVSCSWLGPSSLPPFFMPLTSSAFGIARLTLIEPEQIGSGREMMIMTMMKCWWLSNIVEIF